MILFVRSNPYYVADQAIWHPRKVTIVGGANRDRTDDLYNAIVALSQLSYGPELDF